MTSSAEFILVKLESYILDKYFEESDKLKKKYGIIALTGRHNGDEAYIIYADLLDTLNQIKREKE
jgi:hypothetical protein